MPGSRRASGADCARQAIWDSVVKASGRPAEALEQANLPLPVPEGGRAVAEQRFVTYYRVSTDRQGRSGLGPGRPAGSSQSVPGGAARYVIAEFVEVESGGKDDRPRLKEA